ncbi:hypothetical protein E2562_038090 [Oryza meyeriana var. granulata]|uniref:Uncharacterized protein n=1 Tax=Oryza meyeriana var. granulata TaxID=110450 RepID=A0A6G1EU85_9ORYZ|nr:hypothetical protein E2562_038090 [Oryza meyeriana var. granulata]
MSREVAASSPDLRGQQKLRHPGGQIWREMTSANGGERAAVRGGVVARDGGRGLLEAVAADLVGCWRCAEKWFGSGVDSSSSAGWASFFSMELLPSYG